MALALALALPLLAAGLAVAAGRRRDALGLAAARDAVLAVVVLVSLAFAILFHAFVVSDFSLSYVAQHSNLARPMVFKIAGVRGAHVGSLLVWAWDPVESASFMPWLTGTALMHSMMAQERRGMFRLWNMFLVLATFLLTLLGAFLVRSGVLTSVIPLPPIPPAGPVCWPSRGWRWWRASAS